LPTTEFAWPDLGSNPGSHCGSPATNCMSCGLAWS
jgi:hypothetical protein